MTSSKGSGVATLEGGGEAGPPSDGGSGPPTRIPMDTNCPWCQKLIEPDEDTARVHGFLWHADCYEEMLWEDER